MGAANSSSLKDLPDNVHLRRLCGAEPTSANDPYWNQLLSFTLHSPHSVSDNRLIEESTASIAKNLAINNCRTGNFACLIRIFIRRASELVESVQSQNTIFLWQTRNALLIIRHGCKNFIESLSQEVILQEFSTQPAAESGSYEDAVGEPLIEEFLVAMMKILIHVPVTESSYSLHLEVLNTFIVLLSTQMYSNLPAHELIFFKQMMTGKCSAQAILLVQSLLMNYIENMCCPADLLPASNTSAIRSITTSVASTLWSVVTLGYGSTKPENPDDDEPPSDKLLANQSLLLLLLLTNHCTSTKVVTNPYRDALFAFVNSQEIPKEDEPAATLDAPRVNYTLLYDRMCHSLTDDQTTLLLYMLLHRNTFMKAFILSRSNIDQLVIPLLKILYHAQDRNSHHIYMSLIILLILSEDVVFNKSIHEMTLHHVNWYTERHVTDITLGGLLVLVVIRTIQYNVTRMRDKYLHTNCLAALANMSAQFYMLHPYVAQRIVTLFSKLCKKHASLVNQLRLVAMEYRSSDEPSEQNAQEDLTHDLDVLEEVIRMVLEIINSCLTHSLHQNPHLLYTLLYNKDDFQIFRSHPTFQDLIQNIDTVLSHFTSKLDADEKNISVEEVKEVISHEIRQFRRDRLKKFPELKFRYVEEDTPEEFFIPYVWSLVYHCSNLYFNPARIQLFTLTSDAS